MSQSALMDAFAALSWQRLLESVIYPPYALSV